MAVLVAEVPIKYDKYVLFLTQYKVSEFYIFVLPNSTWEFALLYVGVSKMDL